MATETKHTQPIEEARPEEKSEHQIDQALEDSFPASDPPSNTPMTGLGDSPADGSTRASIAERKTGPGTIITYIGEDETKYAPVVESAMDSAKRAGATLIFYDADAASRFGSPTTTFWSGDRDRGVDEKVDDQNKLEPADLEAAGRAPIARLVTTARAAGIDAYGWLPTSRGADDLAEYAELHSADLLILPADLENVPRLEKFTKGTSGAKEISEKTSVPVVTVDTADTTATEGQATLV